MFYTRLEFQCPVYCSLTLFLQMQDSYSLVYIKTRRKHVQIISFSQEQKHFDMLRLMSTWKEAAISARFLLSSFVAEDTGHLASLHIHQNTIIYNYKVNITLINSFRSCFLRINYDEKLHFSGFNGQPHLSLQTSIREVAIFMIFHRNLMITSNNITYMMRPMSRTRKESPSREKTSFTLTLNITDFESPSRASCSTAGPPLLRKSRPSHFAVLSNASPIASSTVVPSCVY